MREPMGYQVWAFLPTTNRSKNRIWHLLQMLYLLVVSVLSVFFLSCFVACFFLRFSLFFGLLSPIGILLSKITKGGQVARAP